MRRETLALACIDSRCPLEYILRTAQLLRLDYAADVHHAVQRAITMSDDHHIPPRSQSEQPEDLLLTTADIGGHDNVAHVDRCTEEHAPSAESATNEAEKLRSLAEEAREVRDAHREALEKVRQEREQLRDTAEAARSVSEMKRAEAETARQAAVEAMRETTHVLAMALDQMKVVEEMRRTLRDINDARKPNPN